MRIHKDTISASVGLLWNCRLFFGVSGSLLLVPEQRDPGTEDMVPGKDFRRASSFFCSCVAE